MWAFFKWIWSKLFGMSTLKSPQSLSFDSNFQNDQTLFSFSFSFVVPGDSGTHTPVLSPFYDQNIPFWLDRFSLDGNSWASLDGLITSGSNYVAAMGFFQSGAFTFTAKNNTGGSITVQVEVTFIAGSTQTPFTPPYLSTPGPIVDSGGALNPVWNVNPKYPLFDSRVNYMKIASQGKTSFTITKNTINNLTIPHNLGYVPYALVQYDINPNFPQSAGIAN